MARLLWGQQPSSSQELECEAEGRELRWAPNGRLSNKRLVDWSPQLCEPVVVRGEGRRSLGMLHSCPCQQLRAPGLRPSVSTGLSTSLAP